MVPRSVLSVPGSSPRMLDKALRSTADEVVIDLEDAVAPAAKDSARANVVALLADRPGRRISVRVNAVGTPWCHRDVLALVESATSPLSIVLPKTETVGDLAFAHRLALGAQGDPGRRPRFQALIESARGLAALHDICAEPVELEALILGYADLAVSLGRGRDIDPALWGPAQEQLLWAARAHAISAIDGPHLGARVDDDFSAAVRRAAALGYDGKWVIHPAQVEAVNEAFTPRDHDIAWAREVIVALEQAARDGTGAVQLDGQMLDEAVAVAARRVLDRAREMEVRA